MNSTPIASNCKYKISYSRLPKCAEEYELVDSFRAIEVDSLQRVANGSVGFHWAGITWNGRKTKDNFISSSLCVLDFDDPYPDISQSRENFRDYAHAIVTTENHMRAKKSTGIICERYRVIVPWETPITSMVDYEYNMMRLQKSFVSDANATGAHVKFKPSTGIIFVQETGRRMFWEKAPPPPIYKPSKYTGTRQVPPAVMLSILNPGTSRWNCARRAAMTLANCGFDAAEIISLFETSPLMSGADEKHRKKIIRTVKNACEKVKNNPR